MRLGKGHIIIIFLLSITGPVSGQSILSTSVELPLANYSVSSLLSALQDQGVNLAYSIDLLPRERVNIPRSANTLGKVLKELKAQTGIQYTFSKDIILLSHIRKLYTLSGTIKDAGSGEVLIGAAVLINDGDLGTTTNSYGFYSITLPENTYSISYRYVGYEFDAQQVDLNRNMELIVPLTQVTAELDELTISSYVANHNIENLVPGANPISFGAQWPIPYFLGEQDIFQNSLLLPGIRSIGEDATGLNIRGGDIDQNLILLDEATIYNPNHFYGLISVFSPEVINSVEIMKGYIPPKYGGRASSVINVIQREGNKKEYGVSGGIGLVSGRLTAEGPLKVDKGSFLLSIRRSLINFSVEDFVNQSLDNSRTNFQDINTKLNWDLNKYNKLYLSAYYGQDRNRAGFDAIRRWGNRSISLRWNHIFNPRLFSNFTAVTSEYTYQIQDPQEVGSFIGKSNIRNLTMKADFGYEINPNHSIDFGLQSTFHKLKPGERQPFNATSPEEIIVLDFEDALESALYISHVAQVGEHLTFQYGIRYSNLLNFGPGNAYNYAKGQPKSDESITDTLNYSSGKIFNHNSGWEPRISLNIKLNEGQAFKASYSRTFQYIHLISNTVSPAPTDIWKLSDQNISPVVADQISLGYYQNLFDNKWESSLEFYYKELDDIIEFKDGADLLFNENIETELIGGTGISYGMEFFLKRNVGPWRGWLSYTLSNSKQRFNSQYSSLKINDGRIFPADYDKRHDISITSILELSRRVSLSGTFNYATGRPVTLPIGKFVIDGKPVPQFDDRNQGRFPDYHRLDLSLTINGKSQSRSGKIRKNDDAWVFTLYNVYARKNIYSYLYQQSLTDPNQLEVIQYSIFGTIIPSLTYNFKF
jgi:hypothetical protein